MEQKQIITSLDLAKRTEILPGLQQVRWDLVIVDEAHRMSARDESHKSQRYRLGELLRDNADHLLLLTATPHKGDPQNFTLFLQLLDRDAYADVKSIRGAMEQRRAPFYLRRTKEAMVYFPERQADGAWTAKPVFTRRIPRTADFAIDGPEFELYERVTALRQTAVRPRRGRWRRPEGARRRVPHVPLPAPSRFQHLRAAAVAGEPGPTPGGGARAGPGNGADSAAGPALV